MLIPGVSICSLGAAKGHDLEVDETLLHQLAAEIQKKGRVICKMGHRTGLTEVLGWICRPRLVGQKLLGDLELMKSGKSYEFVQDLIANFSHTCGLSPAFSGEAETLATGKVAARCKPDGLHSVDFVESPASNHAGLFSAVFNDDLVFFEARSTHRSTHSQLTIAQGQELPQLLAKVRTLEVRFAAQGRRRLDPNDDEQGNGRSGASGFLHDSEAGAAEGAVGALAIDGLLHGTARGVTRGVARGAAGGAAAAATVGGGGTIAQRLAGIGRDLAHPIESGLPKKLLVGGIVGGVLTGASGALISKLVDAHKKKKTGAVGLMPGTLPSTGQTNLSSRPTSGLNPGEARDRSLYRVASFRHGVAEDELDRASRAYTRAGLAGGVAGAIGGSLKGRTSIGAGVGLLAGLGSVAAIRAASPPNDYGQRSAAEHKTQALLPVAAGGVTAAVLARQKLKQMAQNAVKRGTGFSRFKKTSLTNQPVA